MADTPETQQVSQPEARLPLSGPHPFRDLGLAFTTLTVLPLPARWPEGERPDVASYYPMAGLFVGGVAYALVVLAALAGWELQAPLLLAALVAIVLAKLTRFLHWDGLADVADGWTADSPASRRRILKDTHVGAFGAAAVALVAIAQVAALSSVLESGYLVVLFAVPPIARLAATFSAWIGKPATATGLGASVCRRPGLLGILFAATATALALVPLQLAYATQGLYFGVGGIVAALVVPDLIARRFGGVTGDVMGAAIVIAETLLFGAAAVMWGV